MANPAKRTRLQALTSDLWTLVDQLRTELADVNTQVDALVAKTTRTAADNVDLRSLRRDRLVFRTLIRVVRFALLLDGSRARPDDVSGTDG